jgi:signal transduction histidine kinase
LNNIAKHANANEVRIFLQESDNKLSLEIIDNGIGFDENIKKKNDSYGLIGMKERVYLLNGKLSILSEKDKGTTIKVVMPHNQNV